MVSPFGVVSESVRGANKPVYLTAGVNPRQTQCESDHRPRDGWMGERAALDLGVPGVELSCVDFVSFRAVDDSR